MNSLESMGKLAKSASYTLSNMSTNQKNEVLDAIAKALCEKSEYILAENAKDMKQAKEKGISESLLDRLKLTEDRIHAMSDGVRELIALPDPIGEVTHMSTRPNGLTIGKKRVPLGVIGIIYEARPNVTVDAACLCLKSGNAVILRGGSEAIFSNLALMKVMQEAGKGAGLCDGAMNLVENTARETAVELMHLNDYLDVLIPRGGKGLIKTVVSSATVPVIETGWGNCHIYVDRNADLTMGVEITNNAKTSRPSVCNAAETLLVHQEIAKEFLPKMAEKFREKKVEMRGCAKTKEILPDCTAAAAEDYDTEYGDYIIAVKVVESLEEAIRHINRHGSGHSESIVTNSYAAAQDFLQKVDAAAVYVNASTRYTDGNEFGLGAEIGISTQKMHARGPMGLNELTSYKYIVYGNGQIR